MKLKVSEAVRWIMEKKGIRYTEAGIYRLLYTGKLSFTQRSDKKGPGTVRPGGRIMIDTADLDHLFVHHPAQGTSNE